MNTCVLCKHTSFQTLFVRQDGAAMSRCRTCGLVQVVPMLASKQIASLYHEDFDHFEPYIEQLAVHHAYFRQKIGEIQKRVQSGKLLDIGCAMGALLEEAKAVGYRAEGIDLSNDAVTYCNTHGLKTYHGTVYTVKQLKTESYDVITAFQIIEHERDALKMMTRVYKLLKKNGMVVLATPNYGGFWRKFMGKRWFGFAHPEHVVLLDFMAMRNLLEKAGFRDVEIHKDSSRPFPLSFAVSRAGDYFPWAAWILKPIGKLLDRFKIVNPINPWDDMIAFARK